MHSYQSSDTSYNMLLAHYALCLDIFFIKIIDSTVNGYIRNYELYLNCLIGSNFVKPCVSFRIPAWLSMVVGKYHPNTYTFIYVVH